MTTRSSTATSQNPGLVLKVNGVRGASSTLLAQCEPLLSNWGTSQSTSTSPEDLDIMTASDLGLTMVNARATPVSSYEQFEVNVDLYNLAPENSWRTHPVNSNLWSMMDPNSMGTQLMPRAAKAFLPKRSKWDQFSMMTKFLLSTIRQYPGMMLNGTAPPPFVHHLCFASTETNVNNLLPGPLLRCAGIVALWSTKNSTNGHYIWKIIRIEQRRLLAEVDEYGDMTAVNALQVITIYFLLRISASDDEDANFDVQLIQTMTRLSARLSGVTMRYCDPASTVRPSFGDWVVVESLRRTIAALFIIEFLFDLDPGRGNPTCDVVKYWSEMLLPSAKSLWEADGESVWEQEYTATGNDQRPFYGELLRHNQLDSVRGSLLDRWMAQVDSFGTLVINAASLAGSAW